MSKILLIGKNTHGFAGPLASKGYEVVTLEGPERAVAELNNASLLILENIRGGAAAGLIKATKEVPKIIVCCDFAEKGLAQWLRQPLSYPICSPSEKDLLRFTVRALKDKAVRNENAALKEEISRLRNEVAFFQDINKMLTSAVELNDILVMIMKKVKELTRAEAWSILLSDEETGELIFERAEGSARKKIKKFRLKKGEGIAGWVAQEGVPLLVPDVSKDKRFTQKVDKGVNFKTKSVMCVPITSKGKTLGVLEVVNKPKGESFNEKDLKLLMRLVDQAALAIERASLYQKMEELAITDDLTKLFNSRYLNRTIETELSRSKRYTTSLSLIFLDIDFFKLINDNYGHLVGSKVLVEMGQIIINLLRTIDIVARYGGDEFVIVLPQTTPKDAVAIAERIRVTIERHTFMKSEGLNLKITSSFGVAAYPESAKNKEDLLRVADEAMYRVKHSTRNAVFAII